MSVPPLIPHSRATRSYDHTRDVKVTLRIVGGDKWFRKFFNNNNLWILTSQVLNVLSFRIRGQQTQRKPSPSLGTTSGKGGLSVPVTIT